MTETPAFDTPLTRHAHIRIPLICGPMYPCSNPELVAAVSAAGALGIVQPLALTYVHGYDFRDGLRTINRLSGGAPIGFNALIEAASKTYHNRMVKWVDIALEEGVRFFLTSLGNPRWVCDRVHAAGGVVYHDVTELKWAQKGRDGGVDGLVAVNRDAGGHTGSRDAQALLDEVRALGLPVVAAGGVGEPAQFKALLDMGYAGVQLGTRFIATPECRADDAYKYAIVEAQSRDIVLTERLTGVPVSVIRTPYVEKLGTRVGPISRWMFKGRKTKHWIRTFYALRSLRQLKRSSVDGATQDYWQAGRSVDAIHEIKPAGDIVRDFASALTGAAVKAVVLLMLWLGGSPEVHAQAIATTGLRAPVTLARDSAGIVHIEAANEHDLFFAQGYSAARDRLFQLELWRRQATGTMAEALGPRWVARDRASRLLRYRGSMTTELAHYHPRGAAIIGAFVDGVNAYVDQVRADPSLLPPELTWLGITPQHWTPAVVISRHNALASNAADEPTTARAVREIGEGAVARRRRFELSPVRLGLDSLVARALDAAPGTSMLAAYNDFKQGPNFRASELPEALRRAAPPVDTGTPGFDRWESNNWVIAGSRTASGKPIVANDPHRTISVPSLRYMVHLKAPGWDVIGGGEPAIPGVSIGHNQHGAWGLTVFGIDAEDLYTYALDATDARAYRYRGARERMRQIIDTIRVKGAAPVIVTLQYTRHGPVLMSDSVKRVAVALRAAWLEPGGAPYLASLRLDQARTWSEARAALSFARMPALNWIWADTSGAIGWQSAGIAPIRKNWDGLVPVPGDGRFEWSGFLPIPQLPHETSPARGYVGTANALNVAASYPNANALARTWAEPFRRDRLLAVLDTTRAAALPQTMALQHDETPMAARALVPLLKAVALTGAASIAARDSVLAWNGVLSASSRGAAIYAVWERKLLTHTADIVLPLTVRPILRTVSLAQTIEWLTQPDSLLGANPVVARDFILFRAFNEAVADLTKRFGPNIADWRYGDAKLHAARIAHPLDGIIADSLRRRLSHGPLPRGGYANTLNATGNTDNQTAGASFRVVMDLANWDGAMVTNTPGQSGDPRSPYYSNLFGPWARGEYAPLPYSPAAVKARTAETVVLRP
ncbi:MAG: penicillin acylase family protein [Gemmatimonadota bacterium]|nr:penicillin acylase family protein [Gemmatimonadota bacterium]